MTAQVTVRPFEPTDRAYEAIAAIGNEVYPEYLYSASQIRYDDDAFDRKKYAFERFVAADVSTGKILGYAEYSHSPVAFHPQKFWTWIVVSPAAQRHGIGTQLYEHLLKIMRSRKATSTKTQTRETMQSTMVFLQTRGFVEDMRSWESRLYVKDFDWKQFAFDMERPKQIVMTTLAHEKTKDPNWLQKAYKLHITCMADVPTTDIYTEPAFDHYVRHQIENPNALLDGYFIAKDGEHWIGESFLRKNPDQPKDLYQVGINVKLGFIRQPAWITFVKKL